MRILFLLLLCGLPLSATLPTGTVKYMDIIVNSSRVNETSTNFLHQIDLSDSIGVIDAVIDSANDILICDPSNDTVYLYPRYVVYESGKKLLLYWDGPKHTTSNDTFRICFGTELTGVNSTAVFSNNNITNFWGIDRFSGSTFYDYVGGNNGEGTSVDTTTSKFGTGALYNANADRIDISTILDSVSQLTVSFVWGITQLNTGVKYLYRDYADGNNYLMIYILNTNVLTVQHAVAGSASYTRYDLDDRGTAVGDTILLTYAFDGSGLTNDDRSMICINGTKMTCTFTGTVPTKTPNTPSNGITLGWVSATALFGVLDEISISSTLKNVNYCTDRYRTIFDTTFYAISSLNNAKVLPEILDQPINDTAIYGQSALFVLRDTNATNRQWYKNSIAVGTDDTVYTFIAQNDGDSIWCTVSNDDGSVNSDTVFLTVIPLLTLDSIGIAKFTLYHTGTVDSVYVDGVLAVSEEAGTDSVLVTPATPLMWRRLPYLIALWNGGEEYSYQYFIKKSLPSTAQNTYLARPSFKDQSYRTQTFK